MWSRSESLSLAGAPSLFAHGLRGAAPAIAPRARINLREFTFALLLADLAGASLLAIAAFRVYALPLGYDPAQVWRSLGGFVLAWGCSAYLHDLYGARALGAGFRHLLGRAMVTCAQSFGLVLLLGFALGLSGSVSRAWFLGWASSVFVWVAAARLLWRCYLAHLLGQGRCLERALVLAASPEAALRAAQRLERESQGHIRAAAAAALPGGPGAPTLDWVEAMVREGVVERIVVAKFASAREPADALLRRLARVAVSVTLIPDFDTLPAPVLSIDRIGTLPAVDLDFHPLAPWQAAMKRAEDLLIAGLALLWVLPLLLLAAAAIKLDSPGPVFFRQVRVGFNGRLFRVWKFRTMHVHAQDDDAVRQTSRHDRRVTRVGRFLRRTSIDELPQLFNVLAGDMSVVGPRPHARGMTAVGRPLEEVVADYSARHRLKPGITGWAQVNGCRGEVDSHDKLRRRVAYDFEYIENWSLTFDLWIILRTLTLMVADKNAY